MAVEGIIGKTLDKVYRVDQLLGRGGMGAVYRAHDMALNRDVAIKVMHPHFADDEAFRGRFLQEARAIAALSHPGVVQVYAVGQDLGLLYMVMDLIPGQTLHAWLRRLADESKIVALTESLAIVQQVASALHYAHQKGVLHRDIKPANIMLKPSDRALDGLDDAQGGLGLPFRPVLTDFGLAKLAEGGVHTATGTSMGTPAYMSPEQCLGLEPDPRSDVYSLGVVLFELATGRVPFDVKSLTAAIRCHTQEPPPAPRSINPSLPAEVETIVLRALAKRPEERFASAREMALALKTAIPAIPPSLTVAPTRVDGPGPYVSLMTRLAQAGAAPSVPGSKAWTAPEVSMVGRTIVVVAPDGQSRRMALPDKPRLTVGRTADNDLALPEVGISRHHCHIDWDGQSWSVTDLNSTNGTFLGNSRLLPGISQPWLPNVPLRIGSHWLKFDMQAAPAAPSALAMPSASAQPGLGISVLLEPQALTVDAGQQAVGRLRILNQGVQVDHFSVSVEGLPPAWLTLPSEPLRLVPGEEGVVPLTFRAPREPQSTAGDHPFILRIVAQADPRQSAQAGGTLTINPFHELAAEMAPQQVTTGRTRLRLVNRGNAPTSVSITATDPAEALRIHASPAQLTLQPGEAQTSTVEAKSRKGRPWLGATQRYPFEVTAASLAGQAAKQGGLLVVRPRLPAWVLPLVLLPLAALCLIVGYLLLRPPVIRSVALDPPSPLVGQPVTVRWQVDNAQSVELRPMGISGLYPDGGEYTFERGLSAPTNLSVVAHGRFGLSSAEQPVIIPVITPTPTPIPEPLDPIVEGWSVSPIEVVLGQVVTIKWQVSNAESVTLQPFGTVDSAGQTQDKPQQTTRYTLIAVNKGKSVQKSQQVTVLGPTPTFTPQPSSPWVKSFDIEPRSFVQGQVSTLHVAWDTENADAVTIEPGIGPVGLAGSRDVPAPTSDTMFILVAKNAGGETRSEMLVQVQEPPDLAISGVNVYMPGYTGGCVSELGSLVTKVCIKNQGAAWAGPFVVQAGGLRWEVDGLDAGQEHCLGGDGSPSGQVVVDANNQVAESNEDNNIMMVPLPTAPPVCTPAPAGVSMPFVAGESGWVTEGGGVGVGPLHPQAGDFNNDASVRGFLCFDLSGLPAGAVVSSAGLSLPRDAISMLGDPAALGALRFDVVWYGTSLVPAAYSTPSYQLLDVGTNWQLPNDPIDVTSGIKQALAQGYSRFQVRFAFTLGTNGNGSADEFILMIDRAAPVLSLEYALP